MTPSLTLLGRVVRGQGASDCFMRIPWVQEQFRARLGFIPFPGTFNLEIDEEASLAEWKTFRSRRGIEIVPQEKGFCPASCFHVKVADRIAAAAVVPRVENYPDSKIEIIAPAFLREALGVEDGDLVKIEIFG